MVSFFKKIIVLAIVGAGAAYGVFYWKVTTNIDSFFSKLNNIVDARYDSVSVGYDGVVELQGVHFFNNNLAVAVDIESVKLQVSDYEEMFWLERTLRRYHLPHSLDMSFSGVRTNISKTLLNYSDEHYPRRQLTELMFLSCGPVGESFLSQLYKLGYKNLEGDIEFSLSYNLNQASVDTRLWAGIFDVGDFEFLKNEKNASDIMLDYRRLLRFEAGKSSLKSSVTDLGFNIRLSNYCALQEGVSPEEWFATYRNKLNETLQQLNVDIDPEIVEAYIAYFKPASKLNVDIAPQRGVDMDALGWYEAEKIPEILQLRASLNNTPIKIRTFGWDPHRWGARDRLSTRKTHSVKEASAPLAVSTSTPEPTIEATPEPQFQTGNVEDLETYLGMQVRIVRGDGQTFEGELSKIDKKRCWLAMRQGVGIAQFPVGLQDIQSIEVFK